jgi:hypothetical protein
MKKLFEFYSRRNFIRCTTAAGLAWGLWASPAVSWAGVEELFHRIRGRLKASPKPPEESDRGLIGLPREGLETSLETALNSRCTSDSDDDPKVFHWGMFDLFHKLRQEDLLKVVDVAKIPRINDGLCDVLVSGNELTFRIGNTSSGNKRDWLMVESGMQQQAVCLACAALGVGMVFRNMGKDGTETSDGYLTTVKMKIDAMKPSYGESFWTADAPGAPWLRGNLPEPVRKGRRPLIQALSGLKLRHSGNASITDESLGQVLWAARGRTPHFYKSRRWGLTIPTWAGEMRISGIYLVRENGLFEYINESKGTPTHGIEPRPMTQPDQIRANLEKFEPCKALLVFARSEDFGRAYWEVGYQLINAVLQADASGLSYQALFLDDTQKALIEPTGIRKPVAALVLG